MKIPKLKRRYFVLTAPRDSLERARKGFTMTLRTGNIERPNKLKNLRNMAKGNFDDEKDIFWTIVEEIESNEGVSDGTS